MLNLNLNILGGANKPIVPIQPAPAPTTTTTTTAGPTIIRTDPYSASIELAIPGAVFGSLGMSSYLQDISQLIRGTGTGYGVQPTYTLAPNGNVSAGTTSPTPKWSANGYVSSIKSQLYSYSVSGSATASYNNLNSSSFTIETWVTTNNWNTSAGATEIYRAYSQGPLLFTLQSNPNTTSKPQIETILIDSTGTEFVYIANPYALTAGDWYHTALVRSGSAYNMLLDGKVVYNFTNSATLKNSQTPLLIGAINASSVTTNLSASFQDFRIYKGIAKYPNQASGSTYTTPDSMIAG